MLIREGDFGNDHANTNSQIKKTQLKIILMNANLDKICTPRSYNRVTALAAIPPSFSSRSYYNIQ